jgi:hypothetical protein
MGLEMMCNARQLSLASLQLHFPDLLPEQFAKKVAETWLQEDCPDQFIPIGTPMTWIQDSAKPFSFTTSLKH